MELKTGTIKIRKRVSNLEKDESIFPFRKDYFINLIDEIFKYNDINIILIYQLVFELGITIEQLTRLKFRHIKRNYEYLLFI